MSDSPESVVRKFLAAWVDPKPDELGSFFDDDAVWVDGPQGVRRGVDAIKSELIAQLAVSEGVTVDVKSLVTDGGTVMVEQVSRFSVGGNPISAVVMAVFELDTAGRITQWREAYDLKSVTDQVEAAGFKVSE
jgi:limonene-1,2-epoxide hydrolase